MSFKFSREQTVSKASHSRNTRASIIEFLNWALLEAGSYRNVPESSTFGRLRFQKDLNYSDYKVYAGRRGYWVWESGITGQSTQPTSISVFVNGTLANSSTYVVDYNNGRIIFNTAKLSTDIITATYPCREIVVYDGGDRQIRELDFESTKPDDLRLATAGGSGVDLEVPNSRKAHLPAIVVDSSFNFDSSGYEMGSGRLLARQDISLQCYSDNGWYLDWMHDTLVLQVDNNIPTFDLDTAPPSFMSNGSTNPSGLIFPTKCANFPGLKIFVKRAHSRPNLKYGSIDSVLVTWNVEIYSV